MTTLHFVNGSSKNFRTHGSRRREEAELLENSNVPSTSLPRRLPPPRNHRNSNPTHASMADFKFSCPHCDQHIACDTALAGRQLTCPQCHHLFRIPPPPGADPKDVPAESGLTWQTFGPRPVLDQQSPHKTDDLHFQAAVTNRVTTKPK